jgi:hypothetical protein
MRNTTISGAKTSKGMDSNKDLIYKHLDNLSRIFKG